MAGAASSSWSSYVALRRYLVEHQQQLADVLGKWDEDGDGRISAKEFRQGWRVIELDTGLSIPRAVLDELYDEFDMDGTGNVPFDDILLAIKHMPVPEAGQDHGEASPMQLDRVEEEPPEQPDTRYHNPSPAPKRSRMPQPARPHAASSGGGMSPMTPRPPDQPWVGEGRPRRRGLSVSLPNSPRSFRPPGFDSEVRHEPPRRTNLPQLAGESPGFRRANYAASSASSTTTTTTALLTPEQRAVRRARRERELRQHFERLDLPGFNVPGPGEPDRRPFGGSTLRIGEGSSPWACDLMSQHDVLDIQGQPVDKIKHKTHVGDPGWYVSRRHELAEQQRTNGTNLPGISFNSPLPQRPIGLRGQMVTRPWQMWDGK